MWQDCTKSSNSIFVCCLGNQIGFNCRCSLLLIANVVIFSNKIPEHCILKSYTVLYPPRESISPWVILCKNCTSLRQDYVLLRFHCKIQQALDCSLANSNKMSDQITTQDAFRECLQHTSVSDWFTPHSSVFIVPTVVDANGIGSGAVNQSVGSEVAVDIVQPDLSSTRCKRVLSCESLIEGDGS